MESPLAGMLKEKGVLKTSEFIEAFRTIDRKDFVPPEYESEVYRDYPLPIGMGQTISQPTTVAFMLERLEPQAGQTILDVGSGSGWTTALLAHIVGKRGAVYGVEIVPELVAFGKKNLEKYKFSHAVIEEAGAGVGLPDKAPFDRILVSASARSIPKELIAQLKDGGVMVLPVETDIVRIEKLSDDKLDIKHYPGFVFVPLVKKDAFGG